MAKATYKDAGVDLEVYDQAMARLPRLLHRTYSPRVMPLDGGFAGLFSLDFAGPLFARKYEQPVLVSCTDGVGTKSLVARLAGKRSTIGIDCVAMSVDDIAALGAEPLFFLDYLGTGKLEPHVFSDILKGFAKACAETGVRAIGQARQVRLTERAR